MKSWILSHKILAIVLACVLGAGVICAVVLPIALAHKHEFSTEWTTDENFHWHKCKDEKCNEVSDKAAHVFDKETVSAMYLASEATYTDAAKYYKSCVCGVKGTETFDYGSSLSAKENVVGLKEGVMLGKVYDGEACALAAEDITRNGNGEVTVMYQRKGGVDFGNTAPKNVGEYTVKVSVAATAEWKEAEKTFDFAITAKPLTVTATKEYDGNAVMPATLTGVVSGDDVTVAVTMESKNVGAAVKEVMLLGAAKDNYTLSPSDVDASITAKSLTANGTKVYDGNAVMPVTLTGVVSGETVTVAVTMESKNVGTNVKEVTLAGADKDNYTIETDGVDASITPMVITVEWEQEYDNTYIFSGEPAELLKGDEATITVTMESANVGAAVQDFEITGKDAANYSLAREDVFVEIVKAYIVDFEISNAVAFEKGFYVGATNIPEPTTDYDEIGTGYGENTIVWEMQLESGVWSRTLTKEEVMQSKTGTYRVCIQYAEGVNYNFGATDYIEFTVKAKQRILTVKNFTGGKTYDGKPVANFTYAALEDMVEINDIPGVNDLTSPYDGEKYLEFRRKGEAIYTKVTDKYIPKNAAEYEYRIGITATEEWEAAVSEIKTFTISQVEIKLEKGYIATSAILQNGELLYLATHTPVASENIALRLVNGKAGLKLSDTNPNYVKLDQKKKVSVQNNLDCFRLTSTSNANLSNYKIVKSAGQTSVEITVPPSEKGTSMLITGKAEINDIANNKKKLNLWTTVKTGYFKVGQTVIVYDIAGTKLLEAKIVSVGVVDPDGDGSKVITSQSGCVIPSDGKIRIDVDVTGITYDVNKVVGGTIRVK